MPKIGQIYSFKYLPTDKIRTGKAIKIDDGFVNFDCQGYEEGGRFFNVPVKNVFELRAE